MGTGYTCPKESTKAFFSGLNGGSVLMRWQYRFPGVGLERKKVYKIEGMGGKRNGEKTGCEHCGGCHAKSNSKCITKQLGIFEVINTDYRHIFCYIFYITHKSINAADNKTSPKSHCYILCLQK